MEESDFQEPDNTTSDSVEETPLSVDRDMTDEEITAIDEAQADTSTLAIAF